jgi:adenosylhomocysteinase
MSEIKDPSLAPQGKMNLELAEQHMGALLEIKKQFSQEKPFQNLTIGLALHITKETGVLVRTLQAGGANIALCSCNPLSTQDDVAAALAEEGVAVYGYKGEGDEDYYRYLNQVIVANPDLTIDDGCDLVSLIHQKYPKQIEKIIGGCEETTTGIHRLKAMEQDQALKYPIIAVNDNKTKHLMDNYYGTGQSTLDGIIRASNILFAGKTLVIAGYGSCGKGCALRGRGMGANVIVTEVDPFCALQAIMDGFRVMPMKKAALLGDIFITVTGNREVITAAHVKTMKNGVILANSGHFNVEIDIKGISEYATGQRRIRPFFDEYAFPNQKKIYLVGEGRLVNLAAAEGHPSEVMSLSFCGQALACKYLIENKGKLDHKVHFLPPEIDNYISTLQLKTMGIRIDSLTPTQRQYLNSWQSGT